MKITVIKQYPQGEEVWRYQGTLLSQGANYWKLEARFDRNDMQVHDMILCRGDRFLETFYSDRWYNIFQIFDRRSELLKGWYCNISSPAELSGSLLTYRDYAIDLLVYPDGQQVVLDMDEFSQLTISHAERSHSLSALSDLQRHFSTRFSDGHS